MDLGVESLDEAVDVLNFMKDSVFAEVTGPDGRPITLRMTNQNAIYGAWMVPLITVKGPNFAREDYSPVSEVIVEERKYIASMFVDKKRKALERELSRMGIEYRLEERHANRAFADLYLNAQEFL